MSMCVYTFWDKIVLRGAFLRYYKSVCNMTVKTRSRKIKSQPNFDWLFLFFAKEVNYPPPKGGGLQVSTNKT